MDRRSVPPPLTGALLDALLHQPGLGISVYDRHLRYVYVNEVTARAHGVEAQAHLGKTAHEINANVAARTLEIMQGVLANGEPAVDVDIVEQLADHRRRFWTVTFHPLRDELGAVVGVVNLAHDRTAERAAEQKLRLLLEATRILGSSLDVETSANGVARLLVAEFADTCTMDLAEPGEPPRAIAIAAVDEERQAIMHDLRSKSPPEPRESAGLMNVLRTGRSELVANIDDELLTRVPMSGERLELARRLAPQCAMIVPLKARGRTIGAMTVASLRVARRFDEHDLALLEELGGRTALALDNARLFHDAQEANRTKDEFLGTVSHELRTPLTAILGWAHILKKKRDPESLDRGLEIIERNAKSQAQIIEDILDVSRIISGKLRLDLRPMDVAPAVQSAIDVVRQVAESREIKLETHLEANIGVVEADADRLQQVVWNLLSNAIKFTPKGGKVEVRLERVGDVARIVVRDSGKGIDPEFLPHVFERFRQADSSASRAHAGLGLGLSIVRNIVELHGGTVRAESEGRGKGSRFVVDVPLHAAQRGAEIRGAQPAPSEGPRLDGLRVLVVDDEPDARELIAVILSDQGAHVTTAGSAREALELLAPARADVLVSDIGMPGEDGYSLIRKIRAMKGEMARIPAIALTAYARADDARKAFLAGFQMHVAKPVEPATLTAVVADVGARGE